MKDRQTILIVDDSAAGRSLLKAILKKDDYRIEFAFDGHEALQKALEIKPDLMLLDVILPDMDGFEVCRTIRSNPFTSLMPVIMITALNDRQSKLKALRLGADEFLSKPLDAFEVRARVGTVLKLDRFRRLLYDPITGLPNETLFVDYIDHVMNSADTGAPKPFAVLTVRLSNSVFLNNYLAKTNNREMVNQLTRILHGNNPEVKIISYHHDGHFSVLLESAGREKASELAKNILHSFRSPIAYPGGELMLACKIGIALYPENGTTGSELVENAKLAYGEQTVEYGNIVFYHETIKDSFRNKVEIATNLYKAIGKNEFTLHYQPQIDLVDGKIAAIEALVRWDSELYGFTFPDFFIALAEENGTILNIGSWVMGEALEYLSELTWTCGIDVGLAVNLSALQFSEPNLVDKFHHLTKHYRLKPEKIKIEITESSLLTDPDDARQKMLELKEKGYRISVDDFGTGYASLFYLKNYPVDEIKIDKEFIHKMDSNPVNFTIVKHMTELARALNMKVVAEGVEAEKQLDLLKTIHCDTAQGYHFSKAVPKMEMTKMLLKQPFTKIS